MSLRACYTVWCDNCGNWIAQAPSKKEALADAKESGWFRVRGAEKMVDLCPACTAENKKSEGKR